jgi:hypothetical protein
MTKLQKYRTSLSCVDLHVSRLEIEKGCRERHRHEQCKRTFPWNCISKTPFVPVPAAHAQLVLHSDVLTKPAALQVKARHSVCLWHRSGSTTHCTKCTFSKAIARSSILLSAYSSRAGAAIINLLLLVLLVRPCSLAARSPFRACTSLTLTLKLQLLRSASSQSFHWQPGQKYSWIRAALLQR